MLKSGKITKCLNAIDFYRFGGIIIYGFRYFLPKPLIFVLLRSYNGQ